MDDTMPWHRLLAATLETMLHRLLSARLPDLEDLLVQSLWTCVS